MADQSDKGFYSIINVGIIEEICFTLIEMMWMAWQ